MAWSLVKVSNRPIGKRILRYGCSGQDVAELQRLLSQAGFYFGKQDGVFGLVTGEALALLQRTFQLTTDGVAGREVFHLLNKISGKNGRIIYTVKKNEELSNISQRFAVKKSAWKRIPGQANPNKTIYPGLKILLHEKAFFCWDAPDNKPCQLPVTGLLSSDYQMEPNGELALLTKEMPDQNIYHLIGANRDVWMEVLSSPKIWVRLLVELKKIETTKFGFDLREAPLERIIRWVDFLKFINRNLKLKEMRLLVIPFLPTDGKLENQLYWLNLPKISVLARFIMIEPVYSMETPLLFESSSVRVFKDLGHLAKLGLADKIFLVGPVEGWDWNLDQKCHQKLPYKVSRLIRAQYFRAAQYSSESKFSILYYLKHNERHCLVYRDETGWLDFLERITKLNLSGVVFRNFKDLGKAGPEIIAGSFKILPEEG
jgi:LysM repeat protein